MLSGWGDNYAIGSDKEKVKLTDESGETNDSGSQEAVHIFRTLYIEQLSTKGTSQIVVPANFTASASFLPAIILQPG
jgi:hypothetical protein